MASYFEKRYADIICRAYNNLDSSLFEPILSDDFEYISERVQEAKKGKSWFLEYISSKFNLYNSCGQSISAHLLYQQIIDKYVVVIKQERNEAALELTINDGFVTNMWMRPIDMTQPTGFTKINKTPQQLKIEESHTEYGKFFELFYEALLSKDFSKVRELLAEDVIQILYDNKEITEKNDVISYWFEWLERWNEPDPTTEYTIKNCKYYDREVLSIEPYHAKQLYLMARIENHLVKHMVLCPNPLQSSLIRYWDLDCSPLLFGDMSIMPHKMGKDLEPRPCRIPCMRCGCKSEKLQWYEYKHDTLALGYKGELSVCGNCMEAVEFLPSMLFRHY